MGKGALWLRSSLLSLQVSFSENMQSYRTKPTIVMERRNFIKKLESADDKLTSLAGIYVGIVCKIIILIGMTFCAFALAVLLIGITSFVCSQLASQIF